MRNNKRGIIFITSVSTMVLLTVLGGSFLLRSLNESRVSGRATSRQVAFYLAEAGVDDAARWLRAQPSPPSGTDCFDPSTGEDCEALAWQTLGSGEFSVTIDPDDDNPTSYLDRFTMTATGRTTTPPLVTRRVSAIMQTESFARYSYFTNDEHTSWGATVWFISNDHLYGPVHTNGQFNIAGSPIFDGPMSSEADEINYRTPPPVGGNNPQFNGGLTLEAETIEMPPVATTLRVAASSSGGQWYEGNTTIVMAPDAASCSPQPPPCTLVTNAVRGWRNQPQPLPSNGAVFVNAGNATVSGTLDGQLSIGTSEDLIIADNVRYANDPQLDPDSDDLCGLLAEGDVAVSASAPYNVTIQASVMALDTSFSVENWWRGPPKGILSLYGGLIQTNRGPVGTFNPGTGQRISGYSKDYRYDARFSSLAPPFFPTTGMYHQMVWQDEE